MQQPVGDNDRVTAPQSIETMLFSVEVTQSLPLSSDKGGTAVQPPCVASLPVMYEFVISFGFLTTWTVHHRYSEARAFRKALRSIVHDSSSRCYSGEAAFSRELVAVVDTGLPLSHRFFHLWQSRANFIKARAQALQSFIESLLNAHARCIMECAHVSRQSCCDVVRHLHAFLCMDKDPSILQNIGGYLQPPPVPTAIPPVNIAVDSSDSTEATQSTSVVSTIL
ncbi:hypothetical protein DYB36_010238 [Aphanomyces astaci]|uniref:PX domain-containing protein n=1 Tax=Aphanomyces astaci TaxID=112090 RepID=A0A397B9Z8_APHAT|nr:hypothetical protein DYB36_010238 [Aphanomyces astaci]